MVICINKIGKKIEQEKDEKANKKQKKRKSVVIVSRQHGKAP